MTPLQVRQALELRLVEYLAQSDAEFEHLAREHRALPVHSDMGGTLLLTTAAEVLSVDDAGVVDVEPDEGWRTVALVSAAQRYPELGPLLPVRPPEAVECRACTGVGKLQLGAGEAWCGECCGLGWLTTAKS